MWLRLTSAVMLGSAVAACGGRTVVATPREPVPRSRLAELYVDPGPTPREMFWGAGGRRYAPQPDAVYTFQSKDDAGFSVSYDVVGPDGTKWSAKIGPEAQTEVVLSRVLWGLGYHQPPVYYLPSWSLKGGASEPARVSEARFRPKLPRLTRLPEVWRWADNPFSGTRELKGLLVTLLMLNGTDLKDSNNSVYELNESWHGARRWFVVRDLGAALGDVGTLFPRRNWLPDFEEHPFITAVANGHVEIEYDGRHQQLLAMIGPADVRWAAARMARLTDAQWRDAFRAGNYSGADAERFIRRIKEKISDGLALRVDRRVTKD